MSEQYLIGISGGSFGDQYRVVDAIHSELGDDVFFLFFGGDPLDSAEEWRPPLDRGQSVVILRAESEGVAEEIRLLGGVVAHVVSGDSQDFRVPAADDADAYVRVEDGKVYRKSVSVMFAELRVARNEVLRKMGVVDFDGTALEGSWSDDE